MKDFSSRKKEMIADLKAFSGGALVTVSQISRWSGRSRDWVREHVTYSLATAGSDTTYYVSDVVDAIIRHN